MPRGSEAWTSGELQCPHVLLLLQWEGKRSRHESRNQRKVSSELHQCEGTLVSGEQIRNSTSSLTISRRHRTPVAAAGATQLCFLWREARACLCRTAEGAGAMQPLELDFLSPGPVSGPLPAGVESGS